MDCLQFPLAADMIKNVLQSSGLEDKILTKALKQLDNTEYFSGKVMSVLTFDTYRAIVVGTTTKFVSFNFLPNSKDYEAELIRAQGADLDVLGSYITINQVKTLTALIVRK